MVVYELISIFKTKTLIMETLQLEEVLNSKTYVKENSMVKFEPPREYIEPFLENVDSLAKSYRISAIRGSVNQEDTGEENVAYSRVLVEAEMPSKFDIIGNSDKDSAASVIGMIYALDTQKPVIKVYSGKNVFACTNLTIFNADNLYSQELTGGRTAYKKSKEYADTMEADVEAFTIIYNRLLNNEFAGDELNKRIGYLLKNSFRYRLDNYLLRGMRLIFDPKSTYHIGNDGVTTDWNLYNSVTEIIKGDKNISDKPDKTLNLSRIFIGKN